MDTNTFMYRDTEIQKDRDRDRDREVTQRLSTIDAYFGCETEH